MKVLRVRAVCELLGVSRTTLWRWERAGQFVCRRQLGPGVVGYIDDDVTTWLSGRPSRQSGDRTSVDRATPSGEQRDADDMSVAGAADRALRREARAR
jgi:predicted DNA-binding transcriptional regulator AlpA